MLGGVAVAEGVDGVGHGAVVVGVGKQVADGIDDCPAAGAHQAGHSGLDGLGALGGVAHHQYGFAEGRCLFLQTTAVGEYQGALLHQSHKGKVGLRWEKEDVSPVGVDQVVHGLLYVGVEVDGVDEVDILETMCQLVEGLADVLDAVAEVFASVAGDEYHTAAWVASKVRHRGTPVVDHPMQGIDHGVAGDGDAVRTDAFVQQVLACAFGGSEVEGAELAVEASVHLFGPRAVDVVGAQTGLDVAHGYLLVVGGQGGQGRCGGVAMYQHHVGFRLLQNAAHSEQDARGEVVEILSGLHEVEVVVGTDAEDVEYLVEHLAVLSGDADEHAEMLRSPLQLHHHGSHLDGLRTSTEDDEYGFHCSIFFRSFASCVEKSSAPRRFKWVAL